VVSNAITLITARQHFDFIAESQQSSLQFEGLSVWMPNLMDRLDPAVLRRFDLKIKFDYLRRIGQKSYLLVSWQTSKVTLDLDGLRNKKKSGYHNSGR